MATQEIALAEQAIADGRRVEGPTNIDVERTRVQLDVRTQQLKALLAFNAKPTDRGQVITFGDVLFDTGKSDLKSGARRDARQQAGFLKANPERKVRIEESWPSSSKLRLEPLRQSCAVNMASVRPRSISGAPNSPVCDLLNKSGFPVGSTELACSHRGRFRQCGG